MRPAPARKPIGLLATILGAGALGAFATGVLGGPGDPGPGPDPGPEQPAALEAHRVDEPPVGKGAPDPRVFYVESAVQDDIPPGPGGHELKGCPRGSRAISGYYYQEIDGYGTFRGFGLDDQGSSPFGFRKWAFYFDNVARNESGQPTDIDGVTFGIVCDKDG